MGVREFQGEGNNIVLSGGDGGLVIYTFKLHHHHHHRHHHHHHHHQSSDSCILKTSTLNFQPNYHFTLAGDLSPNILYPIISGFIGWSKFKHKSPSVFNISKERPVQRKLSRQIQSGGLYTHVVFPSLDCAFELFLEVRPLCFGPSRPDN